MHSVPLEKNKENKAELNLGQTFASQKMDIRRKQNNYTNVYSQLQPNEKFDTLNFQNPKTGKSRRNISHFVNSNDSEKPQILKDFEADSKSDLEEKRILKQIDNNIRVNTDENAYSDCHGATVFTSGP